MPQLHRYIQKNLIISSSSIAVPDTPGVRPHVVIILFLEGLDPEAVLFIVPTATHRYKVRPISTTSPFCLHMARVNFPHALMIGMSPQRAR